MKQNLLGHTLLALILFCTLFFPPVSYSANFPDKPPPEHFYVDEAGLIGSKTGEQIDKVAAALLSEEKIPLYVVVINSLASHDAVTYSIEKYASELFNHWGIGWQDRNYGILLLISERDRKARIELGADWGGKYDGQAQQIMSELIVPGFKREAPEVGISDGVRGLDAMARGLALPKATPPAWLLPAMIGGIILFIFIIINLFKTGRKGWAWALLAGLAVILFFIIRHAIANSGNAGSSGGFGGGSSGGGGATGSW